MKVLKSNFKNYPVLTSVVLIISILSFIVLLTVIRFYELNKLDTVEAVTILVINLVISFTILEVCTRKKLNIERKNNSSEEK